ncbi:MAG: ABC transporter ATP-binding protein [Pseudochelatococcus sp.]|uniref:ABC transporter ATP-binding protein n=1 Tax=Pseudochelatococcus sp. TaxID=2020869 RepID=UPI003D8DBBE5
MANHVHLRPVAPPVAAGANELLLRVEGVSIAFGDVQITRDVSFSIARGERVGLVGESGCGKSVTGLSLLRLLPHGVRLGGRMIFEGEDILTMSPARLRQMRGNRMAMVFQEPMSALDPVFTIGDQIGEALRLHRRMTRRECREAVIQALRDVGIPAPERRYDEYPHQLSGGMRQRAMIAMALICRPKLLIADEPTTALDVTIQAQIMDLLCRLSEEVGTALLFITHDLGVVAETCTRMLTMYAGQIVEDGPVDDVLLRPRHPYTSGLLRSLPRLNQKRGELAFIPGRVPAPAHMPEGCRFRARCGFDVSGCEAPQVLESFAAGERHVRCWRSRELELEGAVG